MSSTSVVCGQEGLLPVSFRGGAFTEFFALLRIFEFCVVGGIWSTYAGKTFV